MSLRRGRFLSILLYVMVVQQDRFVTIDYSFTAPDGTLLGSSDFSGPFTFRQGSGDAVPGLDTRLEGLPVGSEHSFVIPAEEAYGERDETLVTRVPVDALPLGRQAEPGMRLNAGGRIMIVTEVTDDVVVMDGNHPLAGIPLHFTVTIRDVSDTEPVTQDAGCGCGGTCSC